MQAASLASWIFDRPSGTVAIIEPDWSIAMMSASDARIFFFRMSIETGRASSIGVR